MWSLMAPEWSDLDDIGPDIPPPIDKRGYALPSSKSSALTATVISSLSSTSITGSPSTFITETRHQLCIIRYASSKSLPTAAEVISMAPSVAPRRTAVRIR